MKRLGKKKTLAKASFKVKRIDVGAFEGKFKEAVEEIFTGATIDFVQTAANHVPSLTGQAKAALIGIAKSLGIETGISPFDPPISDYIAQQKSLWLLGNTPARGERMGSGKMKIGPESGHLEFKMMVTAAHDGFAYFNYWDSHQWQSIKIAKLSYEYYIKTQLKGNKAFKKLETKYL